MFWDVVINKGWAFKEMHLGQLVVSLQLIIQHYQFISTNNILPPVEKWKMSLTYEFIISKGTFTYNYNFLFRLPNLLSNSLKFQEPAALAPPGSLLANAESQSSRLIFWIRICILIGFQIISVHIEVWEALIQVLMLAYCSTKSWTLGGAILLDFPFLRANLEPRQ